MAITPKELRNCLTIAAEYVAKYREYVSDGNSPRKSRDDLLAAAQSHIGAGIGVYELNERLAHETIISFYVAEDKGYSILLSAGLADEDIRFVICKELLHVMIDMKYPEYRSNDVCGHLDDMAKAFLVPEALSEPSVRSEYLAEIAAMEVLFPYTARVAELASGQVDFSAIAAKYGIPQYYVERYLHPEIMEQIGAMYGS